jgi:hypothetical protein
MPGILALLLFLKFAVFAQCGSERWDVKTLQDAEAGDISFTPVISTVHKQLQFTKPAYHEANPRDITEKKVYRIDCILIKYKQEGDKDWHLEVKDLDTNEKFVVEIPDPACVDMNNPHFNKLILARKRLVAKVGPVKTQFRVPSANTKLRVTGVGFFDKSNHPEGFKGRELHPVINLVVL